MQAALAALLIGMAGVAHAGDLGVRVSEDAGRWESGYGVEFYNVVGKVNVTSDAPLRWIKLRIDALDDAGTVLASEEAYTESGEALSAPGAEVDALVESGRVKVIAPGAVERFRTSFLKDEHPSIASHTVTVIDAPPAK